MNIYLTLTSQFNQGRLRAVISSGQAVVLHRIAVMSKDGDWILKEDEETVGHILRTLAEYGARYRFGAPLDLRWLRAGWSSHFEFPHQGLRVRADFVTRPPRLTENELAALFRDQEGRENPRVGLRDLAELKKTNREKDFAVIGELARIMTDPDERLMYSRSAKELIRMAKADPERAERLAARRPLLQTLSGPLEAVETALDAERRQLMHQNEERLKKFIDCSEAWKALWPGVEKGCKAISLQAAHRVMMEKADGVLPFYP